MKKTKTPEDKLWQKLRSAIRLVWSRSYMHHDAIKAVVHNGLFVCPHCRRPWPKFAARVDHFPPLGEFHSMAEALDWIQRCFAGPVRVLCKLCHDDVTYSRKVMWFQKEGTKNGRRFI